MKEPSKSLSAEVLRTCILGSIIFVSLGIPALVTRAARSGMWPDFQLLSAIASSDTVVGLEHFAAGAGVPAGIFSLFLAFILVCDRIPGRRDMPPFALIAMVLLIGIGAGVAYGFHIVEHEFGQASVGVYGGPPRGAIQWWQVAIGWIGIAIFWVSMLPRWFRALIR